MPCGKVAVEKVWLSPHHFIICGQVSALLLPVPTNVANANWTSYPMDVTGRWTSQRTRAPLTCPLWWHSFEMPETSRPKQKNLNQKKEQFHD